MGIKRKVFNKRQLLAIELMARGNYKHLKEITKEVGCSEKTIYKWRNDPLFMAAVVDRSREIIKESLPSVYKVLSKEAGKGTHQHIKILLEHLERLEEQKTKALEGMITFTWKKPTKEEE